MSYNAVGAIALTGGGAGALDKLDGSTLADGEPAFVVDATNNKVYFYTLDASSGAAESSPDVISPDTNAGNKRWILTEVVSATFQAGATTTSAGAADVGKIPLLDAGGKVDATCINDADIDLDNVTEGSTNKFFTATDESNLDDIVSLTTSIKSTSQYSDSLATAVSTIGGTSCILIVDSNQTLTANLSIPDTIELRVIANRNITVNTGFVLTINNFAYHPTDRFFTPADTGGVVFAEGATPYVLSEWFGAVRDGSTDDQAALTNAAAAAQNVKHLKLLAGTYAVEDTIIDSTLATTIGTKFKISGAGREATTVLVNTSDPTGNGLFECGGTEPTNVFEDFTIEYDNDVTETVQANMNFKTPAIYGVDQRRGEIRRMKFSKVYDGIYLEDSASNIGGWVMDDIQMSAFRYGIYMDNGDDTTRIDKLHYWPFDIAGGDNAYAIFEGDSIGIYATAVEDLQINSFLSLNYKPILLTGNGSWMSLVGSSIDHCGMVDIADNSVARITGCYFSKGENSSNCIRCDGGGSVLVSNCDFNIDVNNADVIAFDTTTVTNDQFLSVHGCRFHTAAVDVRSIDVYENGGAGAVLLLSLIGNEFWRTADQTMSADTIRVRGNWHGSISMNVARSSGSGGTENTGNFISCDTDDYFSIIGNIAPGSAGNQIDIAAVTNAIAANNFPVAA